jgi:hypothetical protein
LKHFDAHTKERTVSIDRMLIVDRHESRNLPKFERYCKVNNTIPVYMPQHLSHLLHPLDVGCFAALKTAYRRQAENLMRNRINHITNPEFLPCFKAAYNTVITASNIQGGCRGAGLIPFDPGRVISSLDVKLRTPSPQLRLSTTDDSFAQPRLTTI